MSVSPLSSQSIGIRFWCGLLFSASALAATPQASGQATHQAELAPDAAGFDGLHGGFIENRGQLDPQVHFQARQGPVAAFLTGDSFVLRLAERDPAEPDQEASTAVALRFEAASEAARVEGVDERAGRHHYFRGADPEGWRTDVRSYGRVMYRGLYPGVDVQMRTQGGQVEYDLILAPGACLESVVIRCEGGAVRGVDEAGALVIETALGPLVQPRPVTWHVNPAGEREPVECAYRLLGTDRFGFEVVHRDRTRHLVVDPSLVFSTYLGGSGSDSGGAMAVDAAGFVYVAGQTSSVDLPTVLGSLDVTYNAGNSDAFVAKMSPDGSTLVYATYLGGTEEFWEAAFELLVDASGAVHVLGSTGCSDFPITSGAADPVIGDSECFVAKLAAGGDSLVFSTFLGGSAWENPGGIAMDASGAVLVTGATDSSDFPTTAGAFDPTYNGVSSFQHDAFVAKLSADGSQLLYGTFLGGTGLEMGLDLAVDATGAAHVIGFTDSGDFPVTPGAFDLSQAGSSDGFVAKLSPDGSGLAYATYLGGTRGETPRDILVLPGGDVIVAGDTTSLNYPTTAGAHDRNFNGGAEDAFVTRLLADGSGLVFSTLLGGSGRFFDSIRHIVPRDSGGFLLCGYTDSADFPTSSDAFDLTLDGSSDVFLTELDEDGGGIGRSTFLGGNSADGPPSGLAVDPLSGAVLISGGTYSQDFPTTPGALDQTWDGNDLFVTKLDLCETATASNYGAGWPGTLGVPALTSSGAPVLGSTTTLTIENSRGATTPAVIAVGLAPAAIPWKGGTILVATNLLVPINLPAAGANLAYPVPDDVALCGLDLRLQIWEIDPGASNGVSFTPGLQLLHGR